MASSESKSLQRFDFEGGTFLVIVDEGEPHAVYIKKVESASIDRLISSLVFKGNRESCRVQAVGPEKDVNALEVLLEAHKISLTKKSFRNSKYSILYDKKNGDTKVSKEASDGKTRVLIVDDSKTMRNLLTRIFSGDDSLEVIGALETAEEVEPFLKKHKPDVMTLDINLPGQNGIDMYKSLKPELKVPTVLITSLNINDGNRVFEGLEAGAVDYIQKPDMSKLKMQSKVILDKVKAAAKANTKNAAHHGVKKREKVEGIDIGTPIFIGSSTGGTVALQEIFESLPAQIPPIVVVQHIPALFSKSFAERLDSLLPFKVKEAQDGDLVVKNQVLVAPGGQQIKLVKQGTNYIIEVNDDPPVNRFKPSVDYFFDSVVQSYRGSMIGMILTGMGRDGAQGLLSMKKAGATTIAQSKESCVVFGMPKAALNAGAVEKTTHLSDIPQELKRSTARLRVKPKAS